MDYYLEYRPTEDQHYDDIKINTKTPMFGYIQLQEHLGYFKCYRKFGFSCNTYILHVYLMKTRC